MEGFGAVFWVVAVGWGDVPVCVGGGRSGLEWFERFWSGILGRSGWLWRDLGLRRRRSASEACVSACDPTPPTHPHPLWNGSLTGFPAFVCVFGCGWGTLQSLPEVFRGRTDGPTDRPTDAKHGAHTHFENGWAHPSVDFFGFFVLKSDAFGRSGLVDPGGPGFDSQRVPTGLRWVTAGFAVDGGRI